MNDEHGIIFDTDNFAVHDGPGIRTVIYLKGCPLRCVWCHSPESQLKEPQILYMPDGTERICGRSVRASELAEEIAADKIFFDSSGGGVTLSGGEVLFQPEFSLALLKQLKNYGIHTIVETSGMGKWENLRNIADYTDIFYYDIKSLDAGRHYKFTGAGNELILENLKKLAELASYKIVLRVPLIPGYNDSVQEIAEIYKLACELQIYNVHLLRYNISAPAKYEWLNILYKLDKLNRQSDDYINKLRGIAPGEINIYIF